MGMGGGQGAKAVPPIDKNGILSIRSHCYTHMHTHTCAGTHTCMHAHLLCSGLGIYAEIRGQLAGIDALLPWDQTQVIEFAGDAISASFLSSISSPLKEI